MKNNSNGIEQSPVAKVRKLPLLLAVLARNPTEFFDRVGARLQVRRDRARAKPVRHSPVSLEEGLAALEEFLGAPITSFFSAPDLCEVEKAISDRTKLLRESIPFGTQFNSGMSLGRSCYLLCRSLRPGVVLETGVACGISSAFLLQAVKSNGMGAVWSVDLPPLGKNADDYMGCLIPEPLRQPWNFHRGVAIRVLPRLLSGIGPVDIFIHDSLHTYKNMKAEFEMVWPFLRPGGVLVADDVNQNSAFNEFADAVNPLARVIIRQDQRPSMVGVLVKRI